MTPDHIRQAQFRARRAVKLANANRMEAALNQILDTLAGNTKPMAERVRQIAMEALGK